jgi:hypothetical protein
MSDSTFSPVLLRVIHPLDDVPEQKLYREGMGRIRMTRAAKLSLLTLRGYLIVMLALVAWRVCGF